MEEFRVSDQFYLNGKPFKILSGAIHYFRVPSEDWYHSLYNLKALGFNTVETYVPWNLHEFKKGQFDFSGMLNIEAFLETAKTLGLYAIVRPSPFICSEWEFGGLPAWLLNEKSMRIRSSDPKFLNTVNQYFDELLPRLVKHQLHEGGNILMFQVENEYGSYGEDKAYLRAIKQMMEEKGITMPLFTSDGPWRATLRSGSLIEDDVLVTGNFGSRANDNFDNMQKFFDEHGKKWPLMCMEFWDGWFNRWNEPIIKRDGEDLAQSVLEALQRGSVNLYMFHGGTNFGFMNGCSARGRLDLHQITSYDYDALLNEQGNPTPKYYAVQKMLNEHFPQYPTMEPLVKKTMRSQAELKNSVNLFDTLHTLGHPANSLYPQTMEALGQNIGYTLYRTKAEKDANRERYRVIDGSDYLQFFVNGELVATQYQMEIGEDIFADLTQDVNQIDILVENMGRVNYGHKLLANTQHKGIRTGVCADLHFMTNWEQYTFEWTKCPTIDYTKVAKPNRPTFYQYDLTLDEAEDTFLDLSTFGKGIAFVNGINVGRYWNVGPIGSLYVPKAFLNVGHNEIVVFDVEGQGQDTLQTRNEHVLIAVTGENK
ncbi:beta-galactosidase [Carnobacteriaceae bacterium zg-ZUI252]|nr:beta-galactosidase [Carnobacteriaceae bacterium zg-ZUI252]